ncbi:MAG: tetratricopeptide repeat protein [Candidatus Sericytochromatia bacterium]|nr:tetratricopeptide repeat protein [Candidatus Sericytochromatia bacterium]
MYVRPVLLSLTALVLAAPAYPAIAQTAPTVAIGGLQGIPVADAMTMLLIDAVGQIHGITLIPPRQSLSGQPVSATWTLNGTVKQQGKGWLLAIDAAGPEKLHWEWQGDDLADAIGKTCLRLTSALKISPTPAEWQAVSKSVAAHRGRAGWDAALAGRRWLLSNQPERAAERFRQAAGVDPARASNWLDLAKAYRQAADRGRWQPPFFADAINAGRIGKQELEAANKATQLAPADGAAWGELALAQALAGVPGPVAEATLVSGARVDPNLPDLKLAAALIRDDIPSWTQALATDPPDQALLVYTGARAFAGGDMATATTYYTQVRQQDPQSAAATFGLARCLTNQRRFPEAVALANELTKNFPAVGQWLLGTIEQSAGNLKGAQTAFDAAAAAQPGTGSLVYFQGRIRMLQGDSIVALQHLRKALELDPNHGPSAYTIGVIYQDSLLKPVDAKPYLQQAGRLLPDVEADVARRLRLIGG